LIASASRLSKAPDRRRRREEKPVAVPQELPQRSRDADSPFFALSRVDLTSLGISPSAIAADKPPLAQRWHATLIGRR